MKPLRVLTVFALITILIVVSLKKFYHPNPNDIDIAEITLNADLLNHSQIPDNMETTTKMIVDGDSVECYNTINDFKLFKKESSSVTYIGINLADEKVFVQFKNGTSYIYKEVDVPTIHELLKTDSVGGFVNRSLVRKFTFDKYDYPLVVLPMSPPDQEPKQFD